VVHQSDRSGRCVNVRPFSLDDARVGDLCPGGISPKAHRHGGRRLDIDDLAAPQGERQRDAPCTPADIDYNIVRFDIRTDDRQVWTKRSEWIGFQEGMVSGATSAFISRRLPAAQPRALRQHRVDPSGIPAGRTFVIGRHRSIFRLISVSSTTTKISATPHVIDIGICQKCTAAVCLCGFLATAAVAVGGDGNLPPPRVFAPILAQMTATVGTMVPTIPFVEVSDQTTGKLYSAVWSDKQRTRATAYDANPGALDLVSTSMFGSLGSEVAFSLWSGKFRY
jgi:hypothetical protein